MKAGISHKIKVSGTGCCLVDRLYNKISFESKEISSFMSKSPGDGGLVPGQLVFIEELERFAGTDMVDIINKIVQGRNPDKINVGGPSIVALIHASQMSSSKQASYSFYGFGGHDHEGQFIRETLHSTKLVLDHFYKKELTTPFTLVLSDPSFDRGNGERIFINSIAGAWDYLPSELDEGFFSSDVVVFGGTALVPCIHNHLTDLLQTAKSRNCITIVHTVFDFLSEKSNLGEQWPLGKDQSTYGLIDLLIMDQEEALRLSGCQKLEDAMLFFKKMGTGAVVISQGPDDVLVNSSGELFQERGTFSMPVSHAVISKSDRRNKGDTTGCGDNFAGGILASVVNQLSAGVVCLNLTSAVKWGIVSGGYSCFYLGGVYQEVYPGEKQSLIQPYFEAYEKQWNER